MKQSITWEDTEDGSIDITMTRETLTPGTASESTRLANRMGQALNNALIVMGVFGSLKVVVDGVVEQEFRIWKGRCVVAARPEPPQTNKVSPEIDPETAKKIDTKY